MRLDRWMTDTVTLAAASGVSSAGDPTWSAQRTISARIISGNEMIRQADGTEIASTVKIATHEAITMNDRVWLPSANTSLVEDARKPISIAVGTLPGSSALLYEVSL